MRYDAEHKARTRERVLKEAVLAIRSGGPDNLGVADVMKRAGLTHGGFYAHFDSREALLTAAIEQMFESASGTFDRTTKDLPPREALKAYVSFYLSRAHRDSREWGCPLPLLSGDLSRMEGSARERFAEGVQRLTEAMAAKLRELGRGDDALALAGSALAEMIGAVAVARAMGPTAQSDAVLANSRAAVSARLKIGDA
jgi:TetR/AcrR family transcriptional regulator, transcriptional repressor for nem operon